MSDVQPSGNHLILWLVYREMRALIQFDAAPPAKAENGKK
jgi:hypothetical protein